MKGAVQRGIVATIVGVSLLMSVGGTFAADVTDADRTFRNFTRETATVSEGQVRLEVKGLKEQTEISQEDQTELDPHVNVFGTLLRPQGRESIQDLNSGVIDLVGSYGFAKNAEVGFDVAGYFESKRLKNLDTGAKRTENNEDIGDVLLYLKFKQPVAEHCAVGAGVEVSMPNGPEQKAFGTGEFGVNPVVSTRYQRGIYAIGGNIGYQIYRGNVPNAFNYGAEAIVRASELVALRVEVAGRTFSEGKRWNDTLVFPGFDISLSDRISIRPTGMAALTDISMDWGVGLGVAVTL